MNLHEYGRVSVFLQAVTDKYPQLERAYATVDEVRFNVHYPWFDDHRLLALVVRVYRRRLNYATVFIELTHAWAARLKVAQRSKSFDSLDAAMNYLLVEGLLP